MPKVHDDKVGESQSALFVRKILVFNSKWLPHLSCVDSQGGRLWFLEGKLSQNSYYSCFRCFHFMFAFSCFVFACRNLVVSFSLSKFVRFISNYL